MKFKDMPNYNHDLALGEPMCLMRNINTAKGMVKNKRCYVVEKTPNCVVVELSDKTKATLPRVNFPGETNGIVFTCHQIPLRPIYAGTIHKSQGLTLNKVIVDMRSLFWEHGQLYVALSRIKNPQNLCILLPDQEREGDCLIKPISESAIVSLVNSIENKDVDLQFIQNWEIINNEPVLINDSLINTDSNTNFIFHNELIYNKEEDDENNALNNLNICKEYHFDTKEYAYNMKNKIDFFFGLKNYGNIYSINTIIQIFFNIYPFRQCILKYKKGPNDFPNTQIISVLQNIFFQLSNKFHNNERFVDPLCIIEALDLNGKFNQTFVSIDILDTLF